MWEHRSVSDKSFKETGRVLPNETYVKLMDEVEAVVTRAQDDKFDHETFMTYIPRKGPWEEIPAQTTHVLTHEAGTLDLPVPNFSTPIWCLDLLGLTPTDSNLSVESRIFRTTSSRKPSSTPTCGRPNNCSRPRRSSFVQPATKSAWVGPFWKATLEATTTCSLGQRVKNSLSGR